MTRGLLRLLIAGVAVLTVAGSWRVAEATPVYTAIDLTPPGFFYSHADGISGSGGQQVGQGHGAPTGGHLHALLWSGTPAAVDLNPLGFDSSQAFGISAGQQVGFGLGPATGGTYHALLWSGTPAAVDLN